MNGPLYYLGFNHGWKLAARYTTGTKVERRGIRTKLARIDESHTPFARGVWYGFTDFATQQAEAIKAGLAPRTIRPSKLHSVLNHV